MASPALCIGFFSRKMRDSENVYSAFKAELLSLLLLLKLVMKAALVWVWVLSISLRAFTTFGPHWLAGMRNAYEYYNTLLYKTRLKGFSPKREQRL